MLRVAQLSADTASRGYNREHVSAFKVNAIAHDSKREQLRIPLPSPLSLARRFCILSPEWPLISNVS